MHHPIYVRKIIPKSNLLFSILLSWVSIFLLQWCAIRQAPPGGPEDKTPPKVVGTFPKPDSTNIKHLDFLEIEFDENIDRASVRNQVWFSPELPNGFEIDWKGGKKFRVVLNVSLIHIS